MTRLIRTCLVALTTVALVVPAMAGASASPAAGARKITGGKSVITYDDGLQKAAKKADVSIEATGSAGTTKKDLTLHVTGGSSKNANYVIDYGGGLRLSHGKKTLRITDIVIDTAEHRAVGTVSGHGTVTVFDIGDPNRGNGGPRFAEFAGYSVTFSAKLQKIADNALNTKVFDKHPDLGVGDTTVRYG